MHSVLIIGQGGREHALAWKMAQSPQVGTVYVAPGNAGTASEEKVRNVPIDALDIPGLVAFAVTHQIAMTLVGPEAPLAAGVVDAFTAAKLPCLGPTQQAAMLESSKSFSKAFMQRFHIPTANYATFEHIQEAKHYVDSHACPLVIKADGLASGKGVVIAHTRAQAHEAIDNFLGKSTLGAAGMRIVIESFLTGQELSFMVLTDGQQVVPLSTTQDHKARDDGDQGPNTGGMGAYAPVPMVTPSLVSEIMSTIIEPTIQGMNTEHRPYQGFLYAGLMITPTGPKVLEFNCRLGDPETQPLMMRLKTDLFTLCCSVFDGTLGHYPLCWDPRTALGVVLASEGYPSHYEQGHVISGLAALSHEPHIKVFHSGTEQRQGSWVNTGGRALCVTALGLDLAHAQQMAYQAVKQVHWKGMFYRRDIGNKGL